MDLVIVLICIAVGFVAGAYVNVLIDRIGGDEPLWPPSIACLSCDARRSFAGTVAVAVRPRNARNCPACGSPIEDEERRVGVEIATAALFGMAASAFGASWVLVPFLLLFGALVAFSVVDFRIHRLPDRLMVPMYGISLVAIVVVSFLEDATSAIGYAAVGSVVYFTFLLIPHLLRPKGMAFGDVKLAGLTGLYVGWLACSTFAAVYAVLLTMIASAFLGTIVGLWLQRSSVATTDRSLVGDRDGEVDDDDRADRSDGGSTRKAPAPFAFGPALAAGAILAIVFYDTLPLDRFC